MVSHRCKLLVKDQLHQLNIPYHTIDLGIVELLKPIDAAEREELNRQLQVSGLELLQDKKLIQVERIKNIVVDMIHHADGQPVNNYSHFISEKLGVSYNHLATVFRNSEGITIVQYIILHKTEKIKELIFYDEMNLDQIAYKLCYSSAAHMSAQFKKITGLSPSAFKKSIGKRKNLEDL